MRRGLDGPASKMGYKGQQNAFNPYQILGVAKDASHADVKKAYRKLAKQHHPDHILNDPKAKEKFAEANSAYEIVGDEKKRAQFDRGEIDAEGKPRHPGFEGFRGGGGPGFGGFRRPGVPSFPQDRLKDPMLEKP